MNKLSIYNLIKKIVKKKINWSVSTHIYEIKNQIKVKTMNFQTSETCKLDRMEKPKNFLNCKQKHEIVKFIFLSKPKNYNL